MVIQYDKRPTATVDEKIQSLIQSIMLALGEVNTGIQGNEAEANQLGTFIQNLQLAVDELKASAGKDTYFRVDEEGLWILLDDDEWKVLIATGTGNTYPEPGMYVINKDGRVVNQTRHAQSNYSGESDSPYFFFGKEKPKGSAYSSSSTYRIGQTVVHDGKEYVCMVAISTPEAWDSTHWKALRGYYAFGAGSNSAAAGNYSHCEGADNVAAGDFSHAEGYGCVATGRAAHAEGAGTVASGDWSHASGDGTVADQPHQTVVGRYNTTNNQNNLFAVGNGIGPLQEPSQPRKDAFTVDWFGNVDAAGNYTKNGSPLIQSGIVKSLSVNGNSYSDSPTISFPKAFNSEPNVVVGLKSTSTAGAFGSVSCAAIDVTANGFVVRLFNAGASPRTPNVYWIATEQ